MSSVSLPCPACSALLILDEENAGAEVLCPGCDSLLRMPPTVSPGAELTLLPGLSPAKNRSGNLPSIPASRHPDGAPGAGAEDADDHPSKSAIPMSRAKSAEEERKRLAAAAAAAGAANSFQPEEASLPADHHRIILPSKRSAAVPAAEAPLAPPPADASLPKGTLPTARKAGPLSEPGPAGSLPNQPRTHEQEEISATPTRGPSRFVRPATEAPPASPARTAPDAGASGEAEADTGESTGGTGVRGGFRLGTSRELHFSPMHSSNGEADAAAWGARNESAAEAARGRRFVALGVLLALLAAGGVGYYMLRQALDQPGQTASLTDDGKEEAEAAASENVMGNVEDARRVLQRFLEADTVEKMAAEVRHPAETLPRMERYYAANPLKPRKIRAESQSWSEIRVEDTEFIRGSMELDDFIVYPVALELFSGKDPKVDWESFVNWAEIPWKDFLRKPPEQAVDYRVNVTLDPLDQYYNYSFKGRELDLLCFKLEDPGKYGSCWGYCDKDSEAASKLLFNLKRSRQQGIVNSEGKTVISCMLRLRFPPEGMKTNQVMIEAFLLDSWVKP